MSIFSNFCLNVDLFVRKKMFVASRTKKECCNKNVLLHFERNFRFFKIQIIAIFLGKHVTNLRVHFKASNMSEPESCENWQFLENKNI